MRCCQDRSKRFQIESQQFSCHARQYDDRVELFYAHAPNLFGAESLGQNLKDCKGKGVAGMNRVSDG